MSSNAPPSGYQIGVGAPLNQQYLQQHEPPSDVYSPGSMQQRLPPSTQQQPQQQQHLSPGRPDSYAPPPAPQYNPGAPDIPQQSSQQHPSALMSGGSGEADHASQPEYPRPSQQALGSHQPPGHVPQQYYPPPPYQGSGNAQPPEKPAEQYHPSPPQQMPVSSQIPGQAPRIPDGYHNVVPPPQPPQPNQQASGQVLHQYPPPPNPQATIASGGYPVPPRRHSALFGDDDPSSPVHYTRDPHKLIVYLVPFPKPTIKGVASAAIPDRFLIYTPPPPPLAAPKEGEKEDKLHKVQRKWQEEVRAAKTSDAKTASWKGVKSKATRGISYVMSKTTTSNIDFVNRIPGAKADPKDSHADDGVHERDTTHKTVGLEELVLVYPSSYGASPDQVKMEFINTMMRTKSKAQRDAILATGLLPLTAAVDLLATVVWPFGGLLEADGVWAYSSIRGAKTARSVTKRLSSSTHSGNVHHETEEQEMQGDKLRMTFAQSPRLELLSRYLMARCKDYDNKHFPSTDIAPTETEVLSALGWAPSQTGNVNKNWEDEEWETQEVKEDLKSTLGKAGKEWDKWCQAFAKDPKKALNR